MSTKETHLIMNKQALYDRMHDKYRLGITKYDVIFRIQINNSIRQR